MPETPPRIAVVTGATRGLGRAVAEALGAAGHHVIAVGRTVGALEELDDAIRARGGEAATLVPFDLNKEADAIDRLGAAIYLRWGRLDVLVAAAGMLGKLTPVPHIDQRTFDEVVAVNLAANWRLLRSLDPLLRQSAAGRAVFVTCAAARGERPFWGPSAMTKAALEAMVLTYAAEMVNTPVRANLFDPGPIRTRHRAQAFPGEDPSAVPPPEDIAGALLPLCLPSCAATGTIVRAADAADAAPADARRRA